MKILTPEEEDSWISDEERYRSGQYRGARLRRQKATKKRQGLRRNARKHERDVNPRAK